MAGLSLYVDKKWKQTVFDKDNFTEEEKVVAERISKDRGLDVVFHKMDSNDISDEDEDEEDTGGKYQLTKDSSTQHHATCLLEFLIQQEIIRVTEGEIMDKSKRDTISKIVVIGQTLWFIIQCGARAAERLPVTNLEIMTLAFAALNFVTYSMWWNKPQRVRYPIRIDISERVLLQGDNSKKEENQGLVSQTKSSNSIWCEIKDAFNALGDTFASNWKTLSDIFNFIPLPIRIVTYPILTIINKSGDMLEGDTHYETGIKFDDIPKRLWATFFLLFVLFGGIHCIPWSFAFPTHTEQILWRVCALAVTAFPFVFPTFLVPGMKGWFGDFKEAVGIFTLIILPLLYISARFTLIVLAFMELRALSPDAYKTVEWTTLIPHI
ncbi:hypothetical protein VKT23_019700 [Stygiomarasmius scandens]|uniref:Uncharacterized protein n=1 Tax=Marasmiellus scandens TaxID=2682957 RepID=A0ABR1IMT2_9AGAR